MKQRKSSFTFTELLMEIAVIATLAVMCLPLLNIQMDGMIYLCYLYEAFLFWYTWSKFISNPTHICRIDTEDFVQEMSMILSERDNVVSLTLHAFDIVFY